MISLAGNSLLILSAFASAAVFFSKAQIKPSIFWTSSACIISSFILLITAFIISDFSVKNVFFNSSSLKPLIYKISGSWASHEGSILLYLAIISLISSLYIKTTKYDSITKNLQISILALIQILFLFFIFYTSNPFERFKFTPNEGLGLNPLLQDKALSIHPPLLYIGYGSYIGVYVNAILLLLRPKSTQILLKNTLQLTSIALLFLTAGIGLGAWWAYRELGWGGYWFFDPVENISLMPWLAGIMLHHFLIIACKSGKCFWWSINTALLSFLLTIYGLFFVRSGLISSVHSFAFSLERGIYLFAICVILTILPIIAFIIFLLRQKSLKEQQNANKAISAKVEFSNKPIIIGNYLWLIALLSLLLAIIYPIYYSFFYNNDVAIDLEYYKKIFIPIFVPLMFLASILPYFQKKFIIAQKIIYLLAALTIVLIIYYYKPETKLGLIITSILFTSSLLMSRMVGLLIKETNYFKKTINARKFSMALGHFSLGLLAFTISINILFSKEIEFIGKIGDLIDEGSYLIKLNSIKFGDTKSYYRQIAEFSIQDSNNNVIMLKPENRLYKIENALSQESDIYSCLTYDLMAMISKIDSKKTNPTIHAIIYYRPMIYGIWLAVFLISASFFIYIINKPK